MEAEYNDFEPFKVELDQESLHPYYKPKTFKSPEYLSKEDKSKISIQIEKFLVNHRHNLEDRNKTPIFHTSIRSSGENDLGELITRKEKKNKRRKNVWCSSVCIIGWDYLGLYVNVTLIYIIVFKNGNIRFID